MQNREVSEYLCKLSTRIPSDLMTIVQQKYISLPISKMDNAEILTRAAEALTRIHVITGWNLPNDKGFIKILIDELVTKLKADFYMMNFDEVIFAFRKYGVGVIDWGKNMNLDLICTVLGKYCHDREQASFYEEQKASQPEQKVYTDDELLDMQRGWIEQAYQAMRKGYIPLIYDCFPEILVKDGFIKEPEEMNQFFVLCLGRDVKNLYTK